MESTRGHGLSQGESANQPLHTQLEQQKEQQRRSYGGSNVYFETGDSGHGFPSIPEGVAVKGTPIRMQRKSPSPQNSSAPTTGTTTTPTSVDNASTGELNSKGPGPEFPRDSLSIANPSVDSDAPWGSVPTVNLYMHEREPSDELYNDADESNDQQQQSQRYNPSLYPAALKLLVSNNVAGSIIGRGGSTISELQTQSESRIKLSQTGDYYPGTQDRVCLVQGETENLKHALRLLLERLYMLQEHQHSQQMAWQLQKQKGGSPPAFDFVVKLLVPSSSCGMIIGKSGSNIKYMEETTGVSSVRLSPKDNPDLGFVATSIASATSERLVTVTGSNLECCLQCVNLIVDGMAAHPDIFRYNNMTTSYSRIVPDAFVATTSPRAVLMPLHSPRHSSPEHQLWDNMQGSGVYSLPGMPRRINSSPDLAGFMPRMIPSEPRTPDRMSGFTPGLNSGAPFPSPVQLPASPASAMPPSAYLMPPQQQHLHLHHQDQVQHRDMSGPHNSLFGSEISANMQHSMSAPDLLAAQLEQSMHLSSPPLPSIPLHPHPQHTPQAPMPPSQPLPGSLMEYPESFCPQVPTMTGHGCFSTQVLVPDTMIGSILGRGGRALTELQMMSGTRIRISQRGEYMPGTRSRIVSIRGSSAHAVWQAQYLMSHRMSLPPTSSSPMASAGPHQVPLGMSSMSPNQTMVESPSSEAALSGHVSASLSGPSDPNQVPTPDFGQEVGRANVSSH